MVKIIGMLKTAARLFGQTANMMIGIPDYQHYVTHMRLKYPEHDVMSYQAFFRERQQARYASAGKGGMRCC